MRLQKYLALCLACAAAHSAGAGEPAPAGARDLSPSFLSTPVKAPAADADAKLPLGDASPRPPAPPTLLPEEIPTGTKRPAPANPPPKGKPGATLKPQDTAAELELRVRYRKARNVAETNGQVRAAWDDSRGAKNDYEKRQALKRYYDLLFARMLGTDRGIAELVEKHRKAEAATLTQTRIAPTVAGE